VEVSVGARGITYGTKGGPPRIQNRQEGTGILIEIVAVRRLGIGI
jgi:hypothetical protein